MTNHDLRVAAFAGLALLAVAALARGSDRNNGTALVSSDGVALLAESAVAGHSFRAIDACCDAGEPGRANVLAASTERVAPSIQPMEVAPGERIRTDRMLSRSVGEQVVPIRLLEGVWYHSPESQPGFVRNRRLTFF